MSDTSADMLSRMVVSLTHAPMVISTPLSCIFDDLASVPTFVESMQPLIEADIFNARTAAGTTLPGRKQHTFEHFVRGILAAAHDLVSYGGLSDCVDLDDVACFKIYTAQPPFTPVFYEDLTSVCYTADRNKAKRYSKFLYRLHFALNKLPPLQTRNVYRGVKLDLRNQYPKGREVCWHGPSSSSTELEVVQAFLGETGSRTLFLIELTTLNAREITNFSSFPSECEVIIPGGTMFRVQVSLPQADLTIISLIEIDSDQLLYEFDPPAGGPGGLAASVGCATTAPMAHTSPKASPRDKTPLLGGWKVGDMCYYIGSHFVFENGDELLYGQKGEVMGPSHDESHDRVAVSFEGSKSLVPSPLHTLVREPPAPLLGGWKPGDTCYYVGPHFVSNDGDELRYGQRGKVVGPSHDESHGKVAVSFEGSKSSVPSSLHTLVREFPAPLPGGWKSGDTCYYVGAHCVREDGEFQYGQKGKIVEAVRAASGKLKVDKPQGQVAETVSHSSASIPTEAEVIRVLRDAAGKELRFREVYLLALGSNPKSEQMGTNVRTPFRRLLEQLIRDGKVRKEGNDNWLLA